MVAVALQTGLFPRASQMIRIDDQGASRMLGTMSAFLYSILTNRAMSISWEHPVPFDLLFDSPYIDWSQPFHPNTSSTPHPLYQDPSLVAARTDYAFLNWRPARIDDFFSSIVANWTLPNQPWIRVGLLDSGITMNTESRSSQMVANRGFVLRAFKYPSTSSQLATIGLERESAYACLLNYLLRPKPEVLSFVAKYTSLFSLPTVFSIAIQIRTGDESMVRPLFSVFWSSSEDEGRADKP